MKTIKRTIWMAALMVSMAATANNEKGPKNITVNYDSTTVSVSVLNKQGNTYKVYIYNQDGTMVYNAFLGSKLSLGRQFNFENAPKGTYKIKVVSNEGTAYDYVLNTEKEVR